MLSLSAMMAVEVSIHTVLYSTYRVVVEGRVVHTRARHELHFLVVEDAEGHGGILSSVDDRSDWSVSQQSVSQSVNLCSRWRRSIDMIRQPQ